MTVFVLGLDGASNENLEHASKRAYLPNIKSILSAGARRPLTSVYPYVTAPAWATMFSGVNPGKHGVFDMFQLSDEILRPPNLRNSEVPFLWDYISWAGQRVLVLGIPFIHPAPEVNGVFVTGRFVPRMTCFPEGIRSTLDCSGYEYNEPWNKGRVKKNRADEVKRLGQDELGERLLADFERRITVCATLLDRERWDVAILVESLPDEVFHLCYENAAITDKTWLLTDRLVGEVRARMKDDDALFIVSDHGFSGIDRVLYINYWLRTNGYLYLERTRVPSVVSAGIGSALGALRGRRGRRKPGAALEVSADGTEETLEADDQLRATLKTPHPRTSVIALNDNEQMSWLRLVENRTTIESLRSDLEKLKLSGALKNVFRATELYSGKHVTDAIGQIMIEAQDGTVISTSLSHRGLFRRTSGKRGGHRLDGILIYRGVDSGHLLPNPTIMDILPTILRMQKLPLPDYLDGRPLLDPTRGSS